MRSTGPSIEQPSSVDSASTRKPPCCMFLVSNLLRSSSPVPMPEFKSDAEKQAWLEKMKVRDSTSLAMPLIRRTATCACTRLTTDRRAVVQEHDERVEARAAAAKALQEREEAKHEEKVKQHEAEVKAREGAAAASEGKRLHESDPSYELQKAREAAEAAAAEAKGAIESKAPGWKKAKAKAAAKAKTAERVERKEAGYDSPSQAPLQRLQKISQQAREELKSRPASQEQAPQQASKEPASQQAKKEPPSDTGWHWPWESVPETHAPATHAPARSPVRSLGLKQGVATATGANFRTTRRLVPVRRRR